ncbi:C25 family cysteine peptidase [Patescibacteria group bacterium]
MKEIEVKQDVGIYVNIKTIFIAILLLFFSVGLFAYAIGSFGTSLTAKKNIAQKEITETYSISLSSNDLRFSKLDNYDTVDLPNATYTLKVGSPRLPRMVLHYAIPKGKKFKRIKILQDKTDEIPKPFNIYPTQKPHSFYEKPEFTEPNPIVYNQAKYYPSNILEVSSEGLLGGVNIVSLNVYPIQYQPVSRKLLSHTEIKFQIVYENSNEVISQVTRSKAGKKSISSYLKKMVSNPQEVDSIISITDIKDSEQLEIDTNFTDYLIVTNQALKDNNVFQPLINSRISMGLSPEIVSVDEINTWAQLDPPARVGRDDQETIRNYIKHLHTSGLVYVLLGGDTNIVPDRKALTNLNPIIFEGGGVPTDMYYSDLDGDWDANSNNHFGEEGVDNVDLYPDVFVGRAPVEDQAEAMAFVDKTLAFESTTFDDYDPYQALFIAADDPIIGDQSYFKDMIDEDDLPDLFDPITKLYGKDGTDTKANVMAAFENGHFIANHLDHGNVNLLSTGDEPIFISDIDSLTNGTPSPRYSILYSGGCWAAAIDEDSIGEHWVTNPNGGGMVYVGSSRDGFVPYFDYLDKEFYKSFFTEQYYRIGETVADLKITFINDANTINYMRWTLFGLNLLGDPALQVYNSQLGPIQVPIDSPTIQGAINIASDGETILVSAGTYNENIDYNGKNITIKSVDGPEVTIIDGKSEASVIAFHNAETSSAVLDGFTLQNGDATNGGGISIDGASPIIKNNIIATNNADSGGGIYAINNASPVIYSNKIINNTTTNNGAGLYIESSSANIINNTVTKNNAINDGGGLYSTVNINTLITNNIIWDNIATQGSGIYTTGVGDILSVNYSVIQDGFTGSGNIDSDPMFMNPIEDNFMLRTFSPAIDAGDGDAADGLISPDLDLDYNTRYDDLGVSPNTGIGNPNYVDMGAYERQIDSVYYPVQLYDQSMNSVNEGYIQIQEAIDESQNGYTIKVDPGIYTSIDYSGKNITILSIAEAEDTIIDGGEINTVVKFSNIETEEAVLDGFTIQNGSGQLYGGGIYCDDDTSPTIINNIIKDNSAINHGGGIYCGYNSFPTIRNNIVTGNEAPTGGGIYINYTRATITRNIIINNTATDWGGGVYFAGTPDVISFTNNIVANNEAVDGGGVYLFNDPVIAFNNNTITGNTASSRGGGLYSLFAPLNIKNTIIWDNTPNYFIRGTVDITYSDIQGGFAGTGNLNVDPLFLDPNENNYHLQRSSLCIDAGHPDLDNDGIDCLSDPDDQDPDGTCMDMGALYFIPTTPEARDLYITPENPNWTSSLTAHYTYFDENGDPEGATEIRWYRNGILQTNLNDREIILSRYTYGNDDWYFTIKPKDVDGFGELVTSNSVHIKQKEIWKPWPPYREIDI